MGEKHWVVVLRHAEDDLPIFVSGDKEGADDFAASVVPQDGERLAKLLSIDCTTPQAVFVYEYFNGSPVSVERVKSFD